MTNKKLTFEEMASSYRCCDNGDLNEKHDCLKQNTDIDEVVQNTSQKLQDHYFQAGARVNKKGWDITLNIVRTHGQKMYERGYEQGKNKAVDWIRGSSIWQLVPNTPRKIMCSDKELDDLLEEARNKCPIKESCIGYQNAQSDLMNQPTKNIKHHHSHNSVDQLGRRGTCNVDGCCYGLNVNK